MPLKKVIADISRNVFSPFGGKKTNQKNSLSYFQSSQPLSLPSKHIYYEPPEEFDWDASLSLLPESENSAGEVIVHRLPTIHLPLPEPPVEATAADQQQNTKKKKAYTEEEFTSAILALTQPPENEDSENTTPTNVKPTDDYEDILDEAPSSEDMGDSGVTTATSNGTGTTTLHPVATSEECDCERHCSMHAHENGMSPVLERRNKGVLGRLKNFASRNSYSTSEDGHSHSSDYEDLEEERRGDRFYRESRERSSSSWAGRVRDLHRDVKKKISKLRNSKGLPHDEECAEGTDTAEVMQRGSSAESIPSGSGSSLQPPTPTSSNRSSTSEDQNPYMGAFIGRARALVDCTPSPYDRDGLGFKKGDIIDIIAKHKTGIWVGMTQGKVGHFKFINVEEVVEEKKSKYRHRRVKNEWFNSSEKPETLEELLKQLELEEYTNVLVLNGYDELDTLKEIEKEDLDNLGIVNSEHCFKLLRAVEMLNGVDPDVNEVENEECQIKQSPRDSGCYASHENLAQQETSQPALSNRQFTVDLEDLDTSHTESVLQTDYNSLSINNLDGENTRQTQEDLPVHDDNRNNSYNIYPNNECLRNHRSGSVSEVLTDHSVPYLLSGTKSSPGSPRKTRNKHYRNKSHCHRDHLDFSVRLRRESAQPNHGGYVYGWGSFMRNGKGSSSHKKSVHEYDDVVSDTATEASPGRYVYRKVKQRKGSLQTLIHDTRPPSPTLISKVNKKLVTEKIYLHEEPYTDKTGFCGIPPALVQRYAEELQQSILDTADALDQIRITSLQQQGRRGVPNDFLVDSCTVTVIEPNYSGLRPWLTSLGLPMYWETFVSLDVSDLQQVSLFTQQDIEQLSVREPHHRVYLESAIGALFMRFQRRMQIV